MRLNVCLAAAAVALASCGESGGPTGKDGASAAAGAASRESEAKVEPGEWEMTYETTKVTAPGMPAEALAAMTGQKNVVRICITQEEAKQPSGEIFSGKEDGDCNRTGVAVEGGRIQGTMTCTGGQAPGKMTMAMDGRYQRQSYELTTRITTEAEGMSMTMESRASGRRLGDCPLQKAG